MTMDSYGSYIDAVHSSRSRYPDLYKLTEFLGRPQNHTGRAAVIEFGSDGVEGRHDFHDAKSLAAYLSTTASSRLRRRQLFLLEDLSKSFIEAFGNHFWIDPYLFAMQENSVHWTATKFDYAVSRRLDSWKETDPSFTLRFYEVVKSKEPDSAEQYWYTASNVRRKIERGDWARSHGKYEGADSKVYIVRRHASFWWRQVGDSWDALILVDPPVGQCIIEEKGGSSWKKWWENYPYGHGYVDFAPWNSKDKYFTEKTDINGPPRTSLFDDLAWNLTSAAGVEQVIKAGRDPTASATFLKKIVASNWNLMLEFVWAKLSEIERQLRHVEGSRLRHLADILAEVHLFRRRLSWYHEEIEMSLRSAGISPTPGNPGSDSKEEDDFITIFSSLNKCREKIESLTPVVTGMLSVEQANMSMREAQSISKLTYVALLFLPLSLIASIFSMGGDFAPGNHLFWVYFTVAAPATMVILVLSWIWLQDKPLVDLFRSGHNNRT